MAEEQYDNIFVDDDVEEIIDDFVTAEKEQKNQSRVDAYIDSVMNPGNSQSKNTLTSDSYWDPLDECTANAYRSAQTYQADTTKYVLANPLSTTSHTKPFSDDDDMFSLVAEIADNLQEVKNDVTNLNRITNAVCGRTLTIQTDTRSSKVMHMDFEKRLRDIEISQGKTNAALDDLKKMMVHFMSACGVHTTSMTSAADVVRPQPGLHSKFNN